MAGSRIGSRFERETARQLSKWLYGTPTALWRVAGSGGRATHHARRGVILHPADIVPASPEAADFPLAIECKRYKQGALDVLLRHCKVRSKILGWWKKLRKEARPGRFIPWLVMTRPQYPRLVLMGDEIPGALGNCDRLPYLSLIVNHTPMIRVYNLDDVRRYVDGAAILEGLRFMRGSR